MLTPLQYLHRYVVALALLCAGTAQATPEIQSWTTDNGARVLFVAAPELPMVDVRLVFDAGAARDGERPGLAMLTHTLLEAGTATLSADAVADRLDGVGAQLGGGVSRDMAWLSLRSLVAARYLDPAVDTVAALLSEPLLAVDALERERARLIAAVRGREQSPGGIAERVFFQTLYGGHPYASPPGGTEGSLAAITQEAVAAFHRRYYVAANAVVAIVGDVDRAGAEALARRLVGRLPPGEASPALPPVPTLGAARTVTVDHPSSQSHVLMGQVGMERGDPDYFSLYLANHLLGGNGLVSLLAEEVREKRGLSYSTYSYFQPMRRPGPFLVGLQTRNDQLEEALAVARQTLADLTHKGPETDALEAARRNITGGFALRIDSNAEIVRYLAMIGFYGLPLDYLQRFTGEIEAVTLDAVTDALARRIHPGRMLTVVVGGA